MKKEFIISIIIFIFVIILNIVSQKYTDSSLGEISSKLICMRDIINSDDKEKANYKMQEIKEKWEEEKKKLVIYIEHNELEKVEQYMLEAKSCIETKEYNMAIQAIDTCNFMIDHIKDKYLFSLKNIF